MATLRELLNAREDKTKPIRVTRLEWGPALFISIDDCSGGHSSDGTWSLHEEPKKKVKWYAYAKLFVRRAPYSGQVYYRRYEDGSNGTNGYRLVRIPQLDLEVEE